jgi:hypothetical protein
MPNRCLFAWLLTCCLVAVAHAQETADLVLANGKVFTADAECPAAEGSQLAAIAYLHCIRR